MTEGVNNFNKKKSIFADFSLLLVAIIWGSGFVVIKNALDSMSPLFLMAIRFTGGFIVMSIIFFKKFKSITMKDIKSGIIIGIFMYLAYATQTVGLKYTTAGKQAFLTGVNVVIVPFLVWIIYKKFPGWHAICGALFSLIGIGLLTLQGSSGINIGDILTIICAFFFACHITSVGYFAPDSDPIALSIVQAGTAGVIFIITAFLFEPIPDGINSSVIGAIAYLVLCSTVLAILIQTIAQKYTPSTHAAIILCMESVFGSILAVIILKDVFTSEMVIGCVLIFLAIIVTETKLSFLKGSKRKIENA